MIGLVDPSDPRVVLGFDSQRAALRATKASSSTGDGMTLRVSYRGNQESQLSFIRIVRDIIDVTSQIPLDIISPNRIFYNTPKKKRRIHVDGF